MTRIAFIGAGSVVFTRQLLTDLFQFPDLHGLDVALHDIDQDRLDVATGLAQQLSERFSAGATISAFLDREAALEGADFVVNAVQIGGIEATKKDLLIPASHGLHQTIGDTTGIGGIFRALRIFPFLEGLATDIREICPAAMLLNYTNPMAANITWLNTIAPDITSVGLCHSVYETAHNLAALIEVPFEETRYRAAGTNHQAWLLEWTRNGESLYPILHERIANDQDLQRRVRAEIYLRFGYYPTESSEHASEYLPWFLRSAAQIEKYRIEPEQYIRISEGNVGEFEAEKRQLAEGLQIPPRNRDSQEYAPLIIHSMVTDTEREIHVNLPNAGLIDNLLTSIAVEVPATVDGTGLHPIEAGALPLQCAALNRSYASVVELTVAAAYRGDPTLIRQAALIDPNTASVLTPEEIWSVCNELVSAHGDLLSAPLRTLISPSWD